MEQLATTSMLAAAICWLLPLLQQWQADRALEWRLLAAVLSAIALLVWLDDPAGGLVHWAWSLAAIGLIDLSARAYLTQAWLRPPAWTMTSAAVLAAGLLWHDVGAQPMPLETIAAVAGSCVC